MNPFSTIIANAESSFGLPSGLLNAQIGQESSYNPNAVNGNAVGIAQFMPQTAAQYNVNPLDPTSSINGAAQYMSDLYKKSGSWVSALQSYGTLPQDLNSMTSGQQNVYNIAAAADAQNGAGGYNILSGNDTAFPATGPVATAGGVMAAGQQAASQLGTGLFTGIGLRIGVGVLSILLVGLGVAALALKSSPGKIVVNTVGKAVK